MKKIIIAIAISLALASDASAYLTLVDCHYEYKDGRGGNWGLYRSSDGSYYEFFFGSAWCKYNM